MPEMQAFDYIAWLKSNRTLPEDCWYIPEGSVCVVCDRLIRNTPGLAKLLAARGFEYFDPDRGVMIKRVPVPWCLCSDAPDYRRTP